MKVFLSLICSVLACFILIGRVPSFWISLVFVYIPVAGIAVRKLLDKRFSNYLLLNETTGFYSLTPDAPRFFRWYSIVLDIFLGMLVGFAITYFFKGGWTK